MKDLVNHPDHYTSGGLEVLDIFEAKLSPDEYRGALKANVLKYLFREAHKGSSQTDLKKARFYLDRLIQYDEGNSRTDPDDPLAGSVELPAQSPN